MNLKSDSTRLSWEMYPSIHTSLYLPASPAGARRTQELLHLSMDQKIGAAAERPGADYLFGFGLSLKFSFTLNLQTFPSQIHTCE